MAGSTIMAASSFKGNLGIIFSFIARGTSLGVIFDDLSGILC